MFALCLRLAADEPRAVELTQDVFVRVWEKLGTFRGDAAFTTWLHRVTVNVVYHSVRGAERRARRESEAAAGGSAADSPEARLDLERAIAALPPRARTVFVLHDVEGYTHGEISEMTGMATGTSKAHLHRAHRLLRRSLSA